MKNKQLVVTTLLAMTMLFGVMGNIAQAGIRPPQGSWKWLGYAYNGYDAFHRGTVYAYKANSTATMSVTVYNDYVSGKQLNISALKVGLDWGMNYTSSLTTLDKPFTIPWGESRVIPIIFNVPDLNVVSNMIQYGYTIYLEHVNSTTGPKKIVRDTPLLGGTNFVVYSGDQVDAQKTMQIVEEMFDTTDIDDFNSTKAKLLWTKAQNETFVAEVLYYSQGDFAGAKTHYQTALSLVNQAWDAEETKGGGFDDAQVALMEAQAKSYEASANYLNGLSSMWVLIGVAAVLFAIGYIIRGFATLRKPIPPT